MNSSDLQTVTIDLAERSYHIAIRGSLFDNPLSYAELPAAFARAHQYACPAPREAWSGGSFFDTLAAPSLRGVIQLAQA